MKINPAHQARIEALFDHRKVDVLLAASVLRADAGYARGLRALQSAIYDLDAGLETTWVLSPRQLRGWWSAIGARLEELGIPLAEQGLWLADLRQYQAQECLVRSGGDPALLTPDLFYRYKTCDIRLMRDLLYRADPGLQDLLPRPHWEVWDRLTELEDDLQDQEEDADTYNANYVLAIRRLFGAAAARETCRAYAARMAASARALPPSGHWFPRYLIWIEEAVQRIQPFLREA